MLLGLIEGSEKYLPIIFDEAGRYRPFPSLLFRS